MNNITLGRQSSSLNGFQLTAVPPTGPILNLRSSIASTALDGDGSSGPPADVTLSLPARFFSQLQRLQTQDAAAFTQVVTRISDRLNQAAQNSTGTEQELLAQLSSQFQQAASGDLSGLLPQPPNVSQNLLPVYAAPQSTLGQIVNDQPLDTDLLATQLEQSLLSDLLVRPETPSSRLNLLAFQPLLEPTVGDLFLQPTNAVNFRGVVGVYSQSGQDEQAGRQFLTGFLPTRRQSFSDLPLSQSTRQALDSIVNELDAALASPARSSSNV
jgi:hypothetical protein